MRCGECREYSPRPMEPPIPVPPDSQPLTAWERSRLKRARDPELQEDALIKLFMKDVGESELNALYLMHHMLGHTGTSPETVLEAVIRWRTKKHGICRPGATQEVLVDGVALTKADFDTPGRVRSFYDQARFIRQRINGYLPGMARFDYEDQGLDWLFDTVFEDSAIAILRNGGMSFGLIQEILFEVPKWRTDSDEQLDCLKHRIGVLSAALGRRICPPLPRRPRFVRARRKKSTNPALTR